MGQIDDFIHVSNRAPGSQGVSADFFLHTQGRRWFTEGQVVDSLRRFYPHHFLTVNPAIQCDLIAFAASRDDITCTPLDNDSSGLVERQFLPPMRRYNDETGGAFDGQVVFGAFNYSFDGNDFLIYKVIGHDGQFKSWHNFILVAPSTEGEEMSVSEKREAQKKTDDLIAAATKWMLELHEEILVFNQGYWQKNKDLWSEIQKANWEDVILEGEKKKNIIDDVLGFFRSQERYSEFGVPWKRGVIFYGPPGNGKTISTKALMHDVSRALDPTIECLYVKSFTAFGGPENGIRQIFLKARQMAPCLLIFEDIDSLVSPLVRSYFLNEVDGLESNHGILMIASTNHLEQLDPGIAKRPSRFDRKYVFENPTHDERVQYSQYWRNKLKNNKKVDFPEEMCGRVADITQDFSFAYLKEAFVAALLVIVAKGDADIRRTGGDGLSGNLLWQELKRQINALRKEMEDESGSISEYASGRPANDESVARGSMDNMSREFWPSLDEMYSYDNMAGRVQMQAQEERAEARARGQLQAQMLPTFQISPRYM